MCFFHIFAVGVIVKQPIHTLIATFIFGPYFVQAVAENPVEGQALIGMAVTVSGIVVAIFSPILGALADQTQKRKPWILLFSVFFVISTFRLLLRMTYFSSTFHFQIVETFLICLDIFLRGLFHLQKEEISKEVNFGRARGSGRRKGPLGPWCRPRTK